MRSALFAAIAAVVCGLTACSVPHPIQDDVTDLPLAEIVRKITCEASEALHELLVDRQLGDDRRRYKNNAALLKKVSKQELGPLGEETKELQRRKKILDFNIAAVNVKFDALTAEAATRPPEQPSDDLLKKAQELRLERARMLKRLTVYLSDVARHNRRAEVAQKRVDVAADNTKKLNAALAKYYAQQMAYSFRFRIIETNVASLSPTWKLPLFAVHPGSLTLGGSLGDTKARESERNVKLVLNLEDLHGLHCREAPEHATGARALYYPITGRIGVKEVLAQYFRLLDRADEDRKRDLQAKTIFAKTDAYTDSILFTTTVGASISPSIVLNPTLREQFSGSATLSANRVDYHSVLISLSALDNNPDDKNAAVQKVQIVTDDGIE